MKRIAVVCDDAYLFQKIKLILGESAECVRIEKNESADGFSLCLADIDYAPKSEDGCVSMSRSAPCTLAIPFAAEELTALVKNDKPRAELTLDAEKKTARFKGRQIKLTELEASLLSLLLSENRHFSKEEILSSLWDAGTDIGVVNVYIHYLREKLEADGEKVILSARNKGYKIDGRFLEEEDGL